MFEDYRWIRNPSDTSTLEPGEEKRCLENIVRICFVCIWLRNQKIQLFMFTIFKPKNADILFKPSRLLPKKNFTEPTRPKAEKLGAQSVKMLGNETSLDLGGNQTRDLGLALSWIFMVSPQHFNLPCRVNSQIHHLCQNTQTILIPKRVKRPYNTGNLIFLSCLYRLKEKQLTLNLP